MTVSHRNITADAIQEGQMEGGRGVNLCVVNFLIGTATQEIYSMLTFYVRYCNNWLLCCF